MQDTCHDLPSKVLHSLNAMLQILLVIRALGVRGVGNGGLGDLFWRTQHQPSEDDHRVSTHIQSLHDITHPPPALVDCT